MQEVVSETLHQVEFEFEHADCCADLGLFVQPLACLEFSDLPDFTQVLLQETQAAVEGDQLQSSVDRVVCRLAGLGRGLGCRQIVDVLVGGDGWPVSLEVDLILLGMLFVGGGRDCHECVQLCKVVLVFVVLLLEHRHCCYKYNDPNNSNNSNDPNDTNNSNNSNNSNDPNNSNNSNDPNDTNDTNDTKYSRTYCSMGDSI